jgi:hypothetical protein
LDERGKTKDESRSTFVLRLSSFDFRLYSLELAGELDPAELSLLVLSLLASALSAEADVSLLLLALFLLFRLSVIYQPLPLKITPTGWNTRRSALFPHTGHSFSGSAVIG